MKYHAITISGLICTGKSSLFKELKQKLNWPSYSASQFFRDWCREHNIPLFTAQLRPESLTREVDERMREKLSEGKKIILEGWLAGFMAQGIFGVLKVLLTCQEEGRIKRFAQRETVSQDIAKAEIKKREDNLFQKWTKIYGRSDFLESKYYDLVIDTTNLKPNEVVGLVSARLET
ncbi:MAG: cytidylate kinase family protein [bacterium]|nr:cytidylate kinase family protein [bacterium]